MFNTVNKHLGFIKVRSVSAARLAIAACLVGVIASCDSGSPAPLPENPDGKLVFINYWAEWCTPCREEIPELNQFLKAHGDKVAVYGVNFDGLSGDALAEVETRMGVNFPTLATDPSAYLGLAVPEILPVTFVVSEKSQVVAELVGEQTLQSLEDTLLRLLPEVQNQ